MQERSHKVPDGREVRVRFQGGPDGWVAHLAGAEELPVSGRDLRAVLVELLRVRPGRWPDWFTEAVSALAGRDTATGRRFACPCCGSLTLSEPPPGTYELCGVCFWEDDGVQFRDPDFEGGANTVSLRQARESFRRHGVSELRFRSQVSPAQGDELP